MLRHVIQVTCVAGSALLSSLPASAAERFIVMAFDDVAAGADEAVYTACKNARLDGASPSGLISAQRFSLNDVQMFGGVRVQMPKYLTLFELTASDEVAAAKSVDDSALQHPCAGTDPAKSLRYVYRASGDTMQRTHPDPKIPADGTARQSYAHIVFTVPNDAVKDQFEGWYFSCHMPEILERTGLVSGQRGVGGTGTGAIAATATMGLYRIELPSGMTIAD